MATHSSTLAWEIPRMEEPGRLQSMGLWRVGHDWATSLSLFYFHALEKEMAIHSSIIAWKVPWIEEPGRLQSMGSQRVGRDWATSLSLSSLILGLPWCLSGKECRDASFFLGQKNPLDKERATHFSILAWTILGTGAYWAAVDGVTQSWTRLSK